MTITQEQGIAEVTKLKSPPKYCVILLNDDSTPMDFVINICQTIFNKTKAKAEAITEEVHKKGKVRRSRIYYFKNLRGKKARIKEA